MAAIEEVWGSKFPEKFNSMTSKRAPKEGILRDAEKEARVFPTPLRRKQYSQEKHGEVINNLSQTLGIAATDDDMENNYAPQRISKPAGTTEHMTNLSDSAKLFHPRDPGTDFAYSPPNVYIEYENEKKLNRILKLVEQNRTGYETPSSQDMMLYIFTGVFFLFTLDTFVSLGRKLK